MTRIITLTLLLGCLAPAQIRLGHVNFRHLQHLTESIQFLGDTVDIVHVYSNYPAYEWADAKESGPEGIACVDDAARAAVLYLRTFELTGERSCLLRAKSLLMFVVKMQAEDGTFYNFVHADHSINREGRTSIKSFGWWAARAVWCMGLGMRVLSDADPLFASVLKGRIEKTFPHIDSLMRRYGRYETSGPYRIPRWLLYESGSDVTSELLLGLREYYAVTHSPQVRRYIRNLADGIMIMQNGNARAFPWGLHRSWRTTWHMWGNDQTQALASTATLMKGEGLIQSAEREAKGFYSRLLIDGFMKEIDVKDSAGAKEFEQIAYAIRPMTAGLLRLYDVTGRSVYLAMAGLAASWLYGNNVARRAIYDDSTGRCFDGIRDSSTINMNSGAESTIEALYTLVELGAYPEAQKYLEFRKESVGATRRYRYAVFRNSTNEELTLALDLRKGNVLVAEGERSRSLREKISR